MYYYNNIHVVQHPSNSHRYLVGVDFFENNPFYLPNGRAVMTRKLGFFQRMNPWGYRGGTLMEISLFYRNSRSSKYAYSDKYFFPLYRPLKKIGWQSSFPITQGPVLQREDVLEDFERAVLSPITLYNHSKFYVYTINDIPWKNLFEFGMDDIPEHGFKSQDIVLDSETIKEFDKPFYIILSHIQDGESYFVSGITKGIMTYTRHIKLARQYENEDNALRYAFRRSDAFFSGFEVKEMPPPVDIQYVLWA